MADIANYELARSDYLAGAKYKDIAAKYGVSINTVKSWAKRHGWTRPKAQPNTAKVRNPKQGATKSEKRVASAMVASVDAAEGLTDQQREFCIRYVRTFNATRAYLDAYGGTWDSANAHAWQLLRVPAVRGLITDLKRIKAESLLLSGDDVVEMYMRIAFANLGDYAEWGRAQVPVMGAFGPVQVDNGAGAKTTLMREINDVRFIPSGAVDGQLVSEVKVGKDGASIKLADRMVALKWLADYFELNPKDRHADEYARRRLELDERKAGDTGDDEIAEARKLLEGVPSEF